MHRIHRVACGAFVALCALVHAVAALPAGSRVTGYLILHLLLTGAMLLAWWSAEPRRIGWLIGCGVVARLALVAVPTFTSVDVARYLWDGKLALLGIDPYRTAPIAPELALLRADWLSRGVHLDLPTIYPPAAVGTFALAALGGDPATAWMLWKVFVTAASLGTLWLAVRLLAAAGAERHLALVALSPLLVLEAGVGAHVDAFATLAVAAALLCLVRGREARAGTVIGLGAAVKVLPGLAMVPLLARRGSGWRAAIGCGLVVVAVYAASLGLGLLPIGSLAVPFRAWSFGSPVWSALEAVLGRAGASLTSVVGVALLLGASVVLARRGLWIRGVQVALAAPLLLSPVVYPWYLTPLVPAVALAPSAALVAWLSLAPLTYEVLVQAERQGVWEPAPWPLWAIAAGAAIALAADSASTSRSRARWPSWHPSGGLTLILLGSLSAVLLGGCAHRVWNTGLHDADPATRYVFRDRLPKNAEDQFIVLAFSGGGTRAAAFSYGVLKALRDTEVSVDGTQRRLLDEVDVITSVSGGSYTAAYYGLFGDRIFTDFTREFLYRDWQGDLLGLAFNPLGLLAMTSGSFNRSDLVAAYLDRTLFQHRSFAELSRDGRPFVIINAADINNSTTFSFIQPQFDFLCSDLSTYPVANAVMASSAVPGLFSSIALRNYPDCPERHPPWVDEALASDDYFDRQRVVATALERYRDQDRMPVLRLVDGGVTDNLGVRGSMMSPVAQQGNVPDMAGAFTPEQLRRVRNVLVVVVNAQVYQETDWSLDGREPGLIDTVRASFDAALSILNTETVTLAKQGFLTWQDHVNATRPPGAPRVEVHFAILTFDQITDRQTRERFNAMPTTFRLRADEVDALIAQSGTLLASSPEFADFLRDVATPVPSR